MFTYIPSLMPKTPPVIPSGQIITLGKHKMKLIAVGITGGERYYWFKDIPGPGISMFPADIAEKWLREQLLKIPLSSTLTFAGMYGFSALVSRGIKGVIKEVNFYFGPLRVGVWITKGVF